MSTFYEYLIDPAWQSIGAVIGGVGVFVGAWYGTRLANNQKLKEQLAEEAATSDAFLKILNSDMEHNKKTLENMSLYLHSAINSPIESTFDAIWAASKHLRYSTFHDLVRAKVAHRINSLVLYKFETATNRIRSAAMTIDMEVHDWKRLFEHDKYRIENPSFNLEIHDLKRSQKEISRSIKMMLEVSLNAVNDIYANENGSG